MTESKWGGRLLGIAAAVVVNMLASVLLVALSAPSLLAWVVLIATFVAGSCIGRYTRWLHFGVGLAAGAFLAPFLIVIGAILLQSAGV